MSRTTGAAAAVRAAGGSGGGGAGRMATASHASRATPRSARSGPRARMMASEYHQTPGPVIARLRGTSGGAGRTPGRRNRTRVRAPPQDQQRRTVNCVVRPPATPGSTAPSLPTAVAVIPARYASTRLPGKPLIDLGGLPMIVRVVEQARRTPGIADVVVATDDTRVRDAVEAHGGVAVMTRDDHRTRHRPPRRSGRVARPATSSSTSRATSR